MLEKIVKILLSLILLFIMLYLGKLFSYFFPIGISDSIWGMLILFICLCVGVVKVEWVIPSGRPLTRYMTIFFLPVCAEIIEHLDMLRENLHSFVLATLFSTAISLVAIGLFAQWIFRRGRH